MDVQRKLAGLILGGMVGAAALGIPYAIHYQSLSQDIDGLETELSEEQERADRAEQEANDAKDEAEEAKKQQRALDAARSETDVALEEAAALISSQHSYILDLEAQLARAQRRPSGLRCSDGLSVNEIVSGDVDPCSEWEFDY